MLKTEMSFEQLRKQAELLTEALKKLEPQSIYVCAHAYSKTAQWPDRIIVEGLKQRYRTGRFSMADRQSINGIIANVCKPTEFAVSLVDTDPCMHSAIITAVKERTEHE